MTSAGDSATDRRQRRWAPWIFYPALALYFTWPVLATGRNLGVADWDPLLFFHMSVMRSVYEYGQLPFWNPWYCGGDVLWQNPQVALISPTYLFALFTPIAVAMKLNILLHYAIGLAGMHVLATRTFRIASGPLLFFIVSLFTLAGGAAFHLALGHATFLVYFYLPWLLFFFLRAVEAGTLRHAVCAAALMALSLCMGGVHITFMMAVALACFAVVASIERHDLRAIAILAIVGALAGLLAAPKLLPTLAFTSDPRIVDIRYFVPKPDVMTLDRLQRAYLDPFQHHRILMPEQNYGWHEYGNFIGAFGAAAIVASFAWTVRQRWLGRADWLAVALATVSLLLFLLMLGEFAQFAPYALMRRLPIASQFRLPARYSLVFLLFASAMTAWTIGRGSRPPILSDTTVWVFSAIVVLTTAFVVYRNHHTLDGAFTRAPLEGSLRFLSRPPAPVIDLTTGGDDSPMLRGMMRGRAVVQCNEPLQLRGAIDPARPVVFSDGGAAITDIVFTPNRVEFRALPAREARVFLNERYVDGWRSTIGPLQIDPATQLAYATLPPDRPGRFAFSFRPPRLAAGLILAMIGWIASAAAWRKRLGPPQVSNGQAPAARRF